MTKRLNFKTSRMALLSSAAVAAFYAAAPSALAQDTDDDAAMGDLITVVGSRIAREVDDTAAQPVQIVTREQFDITPAESVADFLRELPINTGFSSSNFNNEYAGGNSSLNLRGVGAQYTLVLVNGRRFGGEGIPDIGAIPPEAVENVQILKTGASSVYGSDAVAGVVNITLKEDYEGLEMVASYGEASEGDAETFRVGAVGGFSTDKLSVTGSIAYQDFGGFARADREFTASRDYRQFGGFDRRSGGIGDPGVFFVPGLNDLVSLDTSRVGPGESPTSAADFLPWSSEGDLNRFSTNEVGVAPPVERINGHWAVNYRLMEDDALTLYTEGYIDDRTQEFLAQVPVNFSFAVPAANPFNPFGEEVFGSYVFDELGFITEEFETLNYQATFGVEGTVGGVNYDISYTKYRQEVDETYTNDINPALLAAALSRTDSTAFNPFCNNCNTGFSGSDLSLIGRFNTVDEIETVDFNFSGELFDLGSGAIQYAFGYQFRDVGFDIDYNDVWENGGTNFSWFTENFVDAEGDRNVGALYGEVLVPLYESNDSGAFITGAEVTASVRNEDYSDFGDATVFAALGKVELLGGDLILRGSYSESFRAPSVAALNQPEQTLVEQGGFFFDPVRDGFFDVVVITGGNSDLGPEEGETISAGFVYTPPQIDGLFVSVDYFDLSITNIIRQPDGQGLLNGTETAGTVTRDENLRPTLDLRLNNGGDLDVAGFDFAIRYDFEAGNAGDFGLYANGVYQTKNENSANSVTTDLLGNFINGAPTPELRAVVGASWDRGAFDANVNVDYSEGVDEFVEGLIDRSTDDWVTVDLQVGADIGDLMDGENKFTDELRVYLGVENVFDEGLPFVALSPDGWDRSIGDLTGRYIYGGIRKKF